MDPVLLSSQDHYTCWETPLYIREKRELVFFLSFFWAAPKVVGSEGCNSCCTYEVHALGDNLHPYMVKFSILWVCCRLKLAQKSEWYFMTRPFSRVNAVGIVRAAGCVPEGREGGPLWPVVPQAVCLIVRLWDSLAWLVGEEATDHFHITVQVANLEPNNCFFLEQWPYFYMLWNEKFWLLNF